MAWINDIVVEIPDAKREMLKSFFNPHIYRWVDIRIHFGKLRNQGIKLK